MSKHPLSLEFCLKYLLHPAIMAQPNRSSDHSESLLEWVKSRLNMLVGADDFAPLLISMDNVELQDYCNNLLGANSQTQSFVNEIISRRTQESRNNSQSKQNNPNKPKKSRRRGGGNKNKNKNDSNTMNLDPNQHTFTSKKGANKQSNSKQKAKVVQSSYRQAGSMTIKHEPISKKSSRSHKKQKSMDKYP